MNIGLTTSYLVGGLVLFSILHMNFTVNSNSTQTTLQLVTNTKIQGITKTLAADIGRMGFNSTDKNKVISSTSGTNKITFQADIDSSVAGSETVSWEFTNTEYDSPNPNDYKLIRTGVISSGDIQSITYAATSFKLAYFDENDNITTDYGDVTQIKVTIVCESPEAVNVSKATGAGTYGRALWQKTFVPPSLQFE